MSIVVTRRDVAWSYAGFTLSYGLNILLLPFVLRRLEVRELGLWYTFLGVNQFAMLLDFGLLPTLMRNVSFCWGGATSLAQEGIVPPGDNRKPNLHLLMEVLGCSRRIYASLSLLALGGLLAIGLPYILYVASDLARQPVIAAWLVFTCGIAANIRYAYWYAMLRGVGAVAESNKALVLSRCAQLTVSVVGLLLGGQLVAVAMGFLCGGIVTRLVCRAFYVRYLRNQSVELPVGAPRGIEPTDVRRVLWFNAWRQGLVAIGNVLIQRSDILICSLFLGLSETAQYGLTQQLFTMVSSAAAILLNSYLPVLSEASLHGDKKKCRHYFATSLMVAWIVLGLGTIAISLLGAPALLALGTTKQLLPTAQCVFLGVIWTLEINHMLFYALLTTRNYVPAPSAWLITGVAVVILSVCLVTAGGMGVWGLLVGHFVAQLGYNNWKWPRQGLKELDSRLHSIAGYGLGRIAKGARQAWSGVLAS